MNERERPSRHGQILGKALSMIADAGRRDFPGELPPMCGTCAFKDGAMPNQMAATGMVALNCVLRIDTDRFACHHAMRMGEPTRLCSGYAAAMFAPFSVVKEIMAAMSADLGAMEGPDEVRAAFDAWAAEIDPLGVMDDYQRAREFVKARAA